MKKYLIAVLLLLAMPFGLHMEYGMRPFSFSEPEAVIGIAILAGSLLFALKKRKSSPVIFFSISWFFTALLPVSNLYPINAYMAEHWLYLPSVGFFLLVSWLLNAAYNNKALKKFVIFFFVALLSFYACITIRQNKYWANPQVFYSRTLQYAPHSPRVMNNLASQLKSAGKVEEAVALYQKVIKAHPDD